MTDYKDGDVIQVNGKPCRIEGGALVPVVERGPLGGELKRLGDCKVGERVTVSAKVRDNASLEFDTPIDFDLMVETNIPPRPTFTPLTAGEAAKVPGIVGRWVAVKVGKVANSKYGHSWLIYDSEILLIEGVDLP